MGRYRYLANNMILFSVSNFVSKILVFLLVPFYTNVLSTSDYGTADVMQTTLLLLVPALTVNMGEAALRFGIDNADKRGLIFRIGMKYTLRASLVVLLAGTAAVFFMPPVLVILFILLFFTNSVYEFLILFLQGCELVRIVVIGSVFSTLVLICSNLVFLLVVKLGLFGYLISQMLAFSAASGIMLGLCAKFHGEVLSADRSGTFSGSDPLSERKGLEKELLSYGKPMILYSTGAFINNAADRYFVSIMCGLSVNGLYGVAYKIPSVLTVFQRIFAQAWQMSASKSLTQEEKDGSLKEDFYSDMYRLYFTFMVLGCAFLILMVRPLAAFMFRKEFFEAWRFVPPLLISVVFGAMTGFLGSICLAFKDSGAMGIATGIGALVNVLLNILLIPSFSAMGAAAATAVSYFIMFIGAFYFVSRHVKLYTDHKRNIPAILLLTAEAVIMIRRAGDRMCLMACAVIFILLALIYLKGIMETAGLLIRGLKAHLMRK